MSAKQMNELVSQSIAAAKRRDVVVDILALTVMTVFAIGAANFVYTILTQLPG